MYTTAKVGETIYENFTVAAEDDTLVSGLPSGSFTMDLWDPNQIEISGTITVSISALGNGSYRASYTPNKKGVWYLVVYHSVYFPWGKASEANVADNNIDSIAADLARILGLVQENYYIDNTTYNSNGCLTGGRIRIYSDAVSVGTSSNVIATYTITATYDLNGDMLDYSVVKI